jgi:hypothetical protein
MTAAAAWLVHCAGCARTWTHPVSLCNCTPGQPRYGQWQAHPAPPADWYGQRVAWPGDRDLTLSLAGIIITHLITIGPDVIMQLDLAAVTGAYVACDTGQVIRMAPTPDCTVIASFQAAHLEGGAELEAVQAWRDARAPLELYAAPGCCGLWFNPAAQPGTSHVVVPPLTSPDSRGYWNDNRIVEGDPHV